GRARHARTRDRRMIRNPAAPRPVGADADADARPPGHAASFQPAVLYPQTTRLPRASAGDANGQVTLVVGQGDAERGGQVTRAAAKVHVGEFTGTGTTALDATLP